MHCVFVCDISILHYLHSILILLWYPLRLSFCCNCYCSLLNGTNETKTNAQWQCVLCKFLVALSTLFQLFFFVFVFFLLVLHHHLVMAVLMLNSRCSDIGMFAWQEWDTTWMQCDCSQEKTRVLWHSGASAHSSVCRVQNAYATETNRLQIFHVAEKYSLVYIPTLPRTLTNNREVAFQHKDSHSNGILNLNTT